MFCLNCGNAIEEGDAFCENCGHKIEAPKYTPCVHCGQLSEEADALCKFCGKNVSQADAETRQQSNATPTKTGPAAIKNAPKPDLQARMLLIFLLDTSIGAAAYFNHLIINLSLFIMDVNADSIAKDLFDMAIIRFSDSIDVLEDLPDVTDPEAAQLLTGGDASYSAPIRAALSMIEEYSGTYINSYKPWVIMITTGEPTDDITAVSQELKNIQSADKARFMTLGVLDYDSTKLKMLTDVVFRQKGTDFTSFFEWLSNCIKVIVRTAPDEKPQLPPLTGDVYRDK